jgi:hypothetical protein
LKKVQVGLNGSICRKRGSFCWVSPEIARVIAGNETQQYTRMNFVPAQPNLHWVVRWVSLGGWGVKSVMKLLGNQS